MRRSNERFLLLNESDDGAEKDASVKSGKCQFGYGICLRAFTFESVFTLSRDPSCTVIPTLCRTMIYFQSPGSVPRWGIDSSPERRLASIPVSFQHDAHQLNETMALLQYNNTRI